MLLLFYEVVIGYDAFVFSIISQCCSLVLLELDHRRCPARVSILYLVSHRNITMVVFYLLWFDAVGLTSTRISDL